MSNISDYKPGPLDTVLVCLRVQALYYNSRWAVAAMWISFGLFHTMRSALTIFGAIYIFCESKSWNYAYYVKVTLGR